MKFSEIGKTWNIAWHLHWSVECLKVIEWFSSFEGEYFARSFWSYLMNYDYIEYAVVAACVTNAL